MSQRKETYEQRRKQHSREWQEHRGTTGPASSVRRIDPKDGCIIDNDDEHPAERLPIYYQQYHPAAGRRGQRASTRIDGKTYSTLGGQSLNRLITLLWLDGHSGKEWALMCGGRFMGIKGIVQNRARFTDDGLQFLEEPQEQSRASFTEDQLEQISDRAGRIFGRSPKDYVQRVVSPKGDEYFYYRRKILRKGAPHETEEIREKLPNDEASRDAMVMEFTKKYRY